MIELVKNFHKNFVNKMINKRYKDIFQQYVHRGEPTPFSIGSLVICGLCFLFLIVATFIQFDITHPWFQYVQGEGFTFSPKNITFTPQIPAMIFIIYILGRNFSYFLLAMYLIVGFFIWPIFVFGGGFDYIQNYLFGYILGFGFAILIAGSLLKMSQNIKMRIFSAIVGVLTIHITGFIYCLILAIFRVIDFSLIIPIVSVLSGNKIIYDILFSILLIIFAPYVKNVVWICMKPKIDLNRPKRCLRKIQDNQ